MKNKVLKLFALTLVILFSSCISVSAMEYKKDSIPNNAYVIGNHMFTDKVVLTTKHIMLGATTIDSDSLSDMIIYYKTPWGEWWDGLSGESINVPDKFNINYIDTEAIMLGDVDQDGKLNSEDLLYILEYIKGDKLPNTVDIFLGDVNQDGDIDDVDISILTKYISDGCKYDPEGYAIKLPYDSGKKYTIKYNLDGGINNDNNIEVYAAISLDFDLKVPIKEGYVFLGWTGSNGDTPQKEVTIPEGTTGNLEYTANWGLLGDVNEDGVVDGKDFQRLLKYLNNTVTSSDLQLLLADVNEDGKIEYKDAHTIWLYHAGHVKELPYDIGEKYIITIDKNDGSELYTQEYYTNLSSGRTIDAPTRRGYVFLGWTGSNGNTPQKEVIISEETAENLEYTANWRKTEFQIRYNPNGGTGMMSNTSCKVWEDCALSANVFVKEGYIFIGWDIDALGRYVWKEDKAVLPGSENYTEEDGDIFEIYAVWKPIDYTITYDLNGGAVDNPKSYTIDTDKFILNKPTKEGYVFLGWTGSNGDTPQKEVAIEEGTTGNLEYKANWVMLGDVEEDGVLNTRDTSKIRKFISGKETLTGEQKIAADLNQDDDIDDVDLMILRKKCADWDIVLPYDSGEKYAITYNLDGGINNDDNIDVYAAISLPFELKEPTKEGYVFLGWTGSNGNTPQKEVTIEEGTTGDLEYTANWLLYGDANADGKVNSNDSTIILDYLEGSANEIDLIAADVNLDGEVDNIDAVIILHFSLDFIEKLPYDSGDKYSINYNLDGGINDSRNPSIYAGISLAFTLEEPTKEGYVFLGWTGSNGNTPQKEVTIEEGTTGNLEYTANWALTE